MLRKRSTDVERTLWQSVRSRQLGGVKFRRQAPIGGYVVDFVCLEAMLIVELDGGQHEPSVDGIRQQWLESAGYRVLRFWNNDVIENLPGVLAVIADTLTPALSRGEREQAIGLPLPSGEGRGEGGSVP